MTICLMPSLLYYVVLSTGINLIFLPRTCRGEVFDSLVPRLPHFSDSGW